MKTLLVPTDLGPDSSDAVRLAHFIAAQSGAGIEFLHVLQTSFDWHKMPEPARRKYPEIQDREDAALQGLEALVVEGKRLGIESRYTLLYNQSVAQRASQQSEKYDLVVMGAGSGRKLQEYFLGTTREQMMREADIPVLVVRQLPDPIRLQRILYASTLEPSQRAHLQRLIRLARELNAPELVVSRINTPYNFKPSADTRADYEKLIEGLDFEGLRFQPHDHYTIEAGVADLATSLEADMVAASHHGRGDLASLFLDSIAANLARHLDRPVLSMRLD